MTFVNIEADKLFIMSVRDITQMNAMKVIKDFKLSTKAMTNWKLDSSGTDDGNPII